MLGFRSLNVFNGCDVIGLEFHYNTTIEGKFQGLNLSYMVFNNSVASMTEEAYAGITTLKYVIFRGNITVSSNAFNGCSGLEYIVLDGTSHNMSGSGFTNCSNLSRVYIDSQATLDTITSQSSCGGFLLNNSVKSVYVARSLTPNENCYLLDSSFTKSDNYVVFNGVQYSVYTR